VLLSLARYAPHCAGDLLIEIQGVNSNGKTADQLKKEIEDLQKIIFDPKSSDKEVSDANIKYGRISFILFFNLRLNRASG
jgi:hypothetical protein